MSGGEPCRSLQAVRTRAFSRTKVPPLPSEPVKVSEEWTEVGAPEVRQAFGPGQEDAEAYLRHPFSREKRAEFEFSQGWNDPEFNAA